MDIDLRSFLRHIQHLGPLQPMRLQMRQNLGTVFGMDGHAKGLLIPLINDNVIHDPALVIAHEGVFTVPLAISETSLVVMRCTHTAALGPKIKTRVR